MVPKQVAEQSPLPQSTTAPVHDAEVSRHSIAQGPRLHSKLRSPQPSTPSQTSVQAKSSGQVTLPESQASSPSQMTTQA